MNQISLILKQSGLLLHSLLPFVLGGAMLGALFKKTAPAKLGRRLVHLPVRASIPIFAILGALSPICTLGSVPIMAGLIQWGLPFPSALAFITASSMITPQISALNFGALGAGIALVQIAGGLFISIVAGHTSQWMARKGKSFFLDLSSQKVYDGSSEKKYSRIILEQLSFVLPLLLAGVLISQILQVTLPGFSFSDKSGKSFMSVAFSTLVSGPLYFCGGAVLPILQGLKTRGLSNGSIVAFLICGPATRFQAFAAYSRFLNPGAVILLTFLIVVLSVLSGIITTLFLLPG